jgi:Asp-tRNA(Asn)/Glu-tRNA(Gln) amidotransferase A subunit family amidase
MSKIVFSSTTQLVAAIRAGDVSAVEVMEAQLHGASRRGIAVWAGSGRVAHWGTTGRKTLG